jgi:hypothetical protein
MALLEKLQFRSEIDTEIAPENPPELPQDPAPGEARAAKRTGRADKPAAVGSSRRAAPAVTKMAKEVAADLATMIELGAAAWGMTDQCCAPVLEAQAKPIADAFAGILSRNPRLLAKLHGSDSAVLAMQALALGRALQPVGTAIYRNHVSKAVDDDQEGSHNDGAVHLANFPAYAGRPRTVPA